MGGLFSRPQPRVEHTLREDPYPGLTPLQALLRSLDCDDHNAMWSSMAAGSFAPNLQLFRSASKAATTTGSGIRPNALVNDYNWELDSKPPSSAYSILHVAIAKTAPECVRLLLTMGADPTLPAGATKQIPLLFACAMSSTLSMATPGSISAKCARALEIVDMLARRSPDSIQLLRNSPLLRTALLMGGRPVMARIFSHGVTIQDIERVMATWKMNVPDSAFPLVARIARFNTVETAVLLLEQGADPASLDLEGEPLLHIVWKAQGNRYSHDPKPCTWVHSLIQAGVDVNANCDGVSMVHAACATSDIRMLEALFQYPVSCSADPVVLTTIKKHDIISMMHGSLYPSNSGRQLMVAWESFARTLALKPVSDQFATWKLIPPKQLMHYTREAGEAGPRMAGPPLFSGLCDRAPVKSADLLPFGAELPPSAMYSVTALDFSLMHLCLMCKPSVSGSYRPLDGEPGGDSWFQNLVPAVGTTLRCIILLLKHGDVLPHVPAREDLIDDALTVRWFRNVTADRTAPPTVASHLQCLLASVLYRKHIIAYVQKQTGETFAFARRKHAVQSWQVFQEEYLRS